MKKTLLIIGSSILSLLLLGFLAFKFTPWPSALAIRYVFNKEGKKVNDQLLKHVPPGVSVMANLQYITGDKDAHLDVYFPTSIENTQTLLPVIVWVHGGGWIAGSKDQISNYCKILAAKGYCVIATDYSLAPGHSYPMPVLQTRKAIDYIIENATRFHADTSRFVLAGDSGGAHIVAQMANIITEPIYGGLVGIRAPRGMRPKQLRGLLLYCGPYDAEMANQRPDDGLTEIASAVVQKGFGDSAPTTASAPAAGIKPIAQSDDSGINKSLDAGLFLRTVLWSYMGKKDYERIPGFKAASVINYVTENFPPSFISAGNGDPLLPHSQALASKLASLDVQVDSLFFNKDLSPALPHEYQFNLDNEQGQLALARSLTFLESATTKKQ